MNSKRTQMVEWNKKVKMVYYNTWKLNSVKRYKFWEKQNQITGMKSSLRQTGKAQLEE